MGEQKERWSLIEALRMILATNGGWQGRRKTHVAVMMYERTPTTCEVVLLEDCDLEASFGETGCCCDTAYSSTDYDCSLLAGLLGHGRWGG